LLNTLIRIAVLFSLYTGAAQAQPFPPITGAIPTDSTELMPRKWYQTFGIRGYMQARYNRLLETNPNLQCEQCDRSWGQNGGFFMRRIRLIFYGQLHDRVYIYIQPDFASSASNIGLNYGQIRDAYMDIGVDKKSQFRFRIGQSKVPFGFENMQSSQNRLPLDRNDALNSPLSNERDLGVFFYYAPDHIRKRFTSLIAENLKGSGDYGIVGFGVYNGQTANRPEMNNAPHVVARVTYPFKIKKQIFEPAVQAYTGKYVLYNEQLSSGVKVNSDRTYIDQRVAGTLVLYPKPLGFQAEYNFGRGPEFNPHTDSIETRKLHGGYIMLNYMLPIKGHLIYPFVRGQYYQGGKKHERDARSHTVKELEIGVEWQPIKYFELVAMYTISNRRFEDFQNPINRQGGRLLRLQAQVNF
jgi:hypothetical protein